MKLTKPQKASIGYMFASMAYHYTINRVAPLENIPIKTPDEMRTIIASDPFLKGYTQTAVKNFTEVLEKGEDLNGNKASASIHG